MVETLLALGVDVPVAGRGVVVLLDQFDLHLAGHGKGGGHIDDGRLSPVPDPGQFHVAQHEPRAVAGLTCEAADRLVHVVDQVGVLNDLILGQSHEGFPYAVKKSARGVPVGS